MSRSCECVTRGYGREACSDYLSTSQLFTRSRWFWGNPALVKDRAIADQHLGLPAGGVQAFPIGAIGGILGGTRKDEKAVFVIGRQKHRRHRAGEHLIILENALQGVEPALWVGVIAFNKAEKKRLRAGIDDVLVDEMHPADINRAEAAIADGVAHPIELSLTVIIAVSDGWDGQDAGFQLALHDHALINRHEQGGDRDDRDGDRHDDLDQTDAA